MKWFINSKVVVKIISIFIIMFISLVFLSYTSFRNSRDLYNDSTQMYYEKLLPVQWLNTMRHHLRNNEAAAYEMMLSHDSVRIEELRNGVKERTVIYDRMFDDYKSLPTLSEFEKEHLDIYIKALSEYKHNRDIAIKLAISGQKERAYTHYRNFVQGPLAITQRELQLLAQYNEDAALKINEQNKAEFSILKKKLAFTVIITLTLSLLIVFYITGLIIKPLNSMVIKLKDVARGDLTVRAEIMSRDEVGQLGYALNHTLDKMQSIIKKVLNTALQVEVTSKELASNAEQTSKAASEIAESITETSAGSEQQLLIVSSAVSMIENVSVRIREVASHADNMASLSQKSRDAATDGGRLISATREQMQAIENAINDSSAVVLKLGQYSAGIGQIVNTIRGITEQTNLLALNAAIEAAREGEHGKGFAVVADEVGKLAQESEDAAKQIEILIKSIQQEIDRAVSAMARGTEEVRRGTDVVNIAGVSFDEILKSIDYIVMLIQDTANVMSKMSHDGEEIVRHVRDIDDISRRISEGTQTVSAATEEQSASMEEVAAVNEQLVFLAQELNEAVNVFKA